MKVEEPVRAGLERADHQRGRAVRGQHRLLVELQALELRRTVADIVKLDLQTTACRNVEPRPVDDPVLEFDAEDGLLLGGRRGKQQRSDQADQQHAHDCDPSSFAAQARIRHQVPVRSWHAEAVQAPCRSVGALLGGPA